MKKRTNNKPNTNIKASQSQKQTSQGVKIEGAEEVDIKKDDVISISKNDLQEMLANRDAEFKSELEEQRKKLYEEFSLEKEKIKIEIEGKTSSMASVDNLDALVARVNGNPSPETIQNQLKIKDVEIIVDGEIVKRVECEIVCANRSPVQQLLTLDLVAKNPEFASQFAKHFQKLATEQGTDLDYELEINNVLINRGIRAKRTLKEMSRSFLLQLLDIYGQNSSIVTRIVAIQNQLTGKRK